MIQLHSQNLKYAILLKDEQIGLLYVTRTIQKDRSEYHLHSTIKVEKIISMVIEYEMTATFVDGILQKSFISQQSNGRFNTRTQTTKTATGYLVEMLTGNKKVKEPIDFNLCTLYFQEPMGRKRIWSDSYGTFIKVRPLVEHQYELLLPDGKKNIYSYNYGICSKVETEQLFSKIYFRLLPSK